MAAVAPFAIILGALTAFAILVTSFWTPISERAGGFGERFQTDLELAGMQVDPRRYGFITLAVGAAVWVVLIFVIRPNPFVGFLLLLLCAALTFYGAKQYIKLRRARRIAQFQDQLEEALRALSSGVRVGLGIRQAFIMTAEQSREPVRHEFLRVVGLTNLGVSILDAFDQMAVRMTNHETRMLARVLRVQSETGGDLGGVLEGLANTIRDRRRLRRRISAMTAQGRATAWLLGFIPIGIGLFLVVFEPQLRTAMLFTLLGRVFLAAAFALDMVAIVSIMKIVQIDP